jgi:hypothetical protein
MYDDCLCRVEVLREPRKGLNAGFLWISDDERYIVPDALL